MIKRTVTVCLCFFFCALLIAQNDNDKLSLLYLNSFGNKDSLEYRKQFFENYPNTFLEFRNTYNNPKSSLYSQNYNHFKLFSTLEVIDDTTFMNKLINLSIGGYWDADAVTMLQLLIGKEILKNPKLLTYLLQKRTPAEIRSFTYFYFDGINLRFDKFPEQLEKIKTYDPFIYELIKSSFQNVKSDRAYINGK